eukprot:6523871-Alexandrium_andersonii.AAC.1
MHFADQSSVLNIWRRSLVIGVLPRGLPIRSPFPPVRNLYLEERRSALPGAVERRRLASWSACS